MWPKVVFFPVYFVFWLQGLFINAGLKTSMTAMDAAFMASSEIVDEAVSGSHDRETNIDAAMDKVIRPLFNVNIRIVYIPKNKNKQKAHIKLREIVGAFTV